MERERLMRKKRLEERDLIQIKKTVANWRQS